MFQRTPRSGKWGHLRFETQNRVFLQLPTYQLPGDGRLSSSWPRASTAGGFSLARRDGFRCSGLLSRAGWGRVGQPYGMALRRGDGRDSYTEIGGGMKFVQVDQKVHIIEGRKVLLIQFFKTVINVLWTFEWRERLAVLTRQADTVKPCSW